MLINNSARLKGLFFSDLNFCRVRNEENTSFWFSKWTGNQTISEAYPELYAKSTSPFMTVAAAGNWEGSVWVWGVGGWFNALDDEDVDLRNQLIDQLQNLNPDSYGRDECLWVTDEGSGFSVKDCGAEISKRDTV